MEVIDTVTSFAIGFTCFFAIIVTIIQFVITKSNNRKELRIRQDIEKVTCLTIKDENDANRKQSIKEDYLYRLLELHHNQALQQANIQFWFSIFAAILGFALIIIIIFFSQKEIWYEYIIRTIPGAIIEGISVLFISQARETRDRATNFFMELNYDRKIEKSIEIAEAIDRGEIKANVKAKIALHIIGIKEKEDDK